VTNLKNNLSVEVIINDRMHGRNQRIIDVSAQAAKVLRFYNNGVCRVRVELISDDRQK
jgi:rare lipoprotein A